MSLQMKISLKIVGNSTSFQALKRIKLNRVKRFANYLLIFSISSQLKPRNLVTHKELLSPRIGLF